MTEDKDKTNKKYMFSGKKSDFECWEDKFMTNASRKNFNELLTKKPEDMPKKKPTNATEAGKESKDVIKLRALNKFRFQELKLCMNTELKAGTIAWRIVKGCTSSDYPNGNLRLAWKKLHDKYLPTSAPTKVKLKKAFQAMKLKNKEDDPDEWITELEEMRARLADMNSTMDDDDFLIHILNNLPPEYETTVESLEDKIGAETDPLTIEKLRDKLNLKFDRLNGNNDSDDDSDGDPDEKAMITVQFKGRCSNCGK
jgi:hypothetical protein